MKEAELKRILPWMYLLSAIAGYTDALTLNEFGTASSHVTGSLYRLFEGIYTKPLIAVSILFVVVFIFFLGSLIAGLVPNSANDRLIGHCFIAFGILCAICMLFWNQIPSYLLIFINGFQNGVTSQFRSLRIRTTHFTGNLTDVGLLVAHIIQGNRSENRALKILLYGLLSFGLGILGCLAVTYVPAVNYFWVVPVLYTLAGTYYLLVLTQGEFS